MDISSFSDDNFEVKDWINRTFKTAEALENKDAFASSLVMKLQLYVQQVNSALEDTSQQVLQGLPRVMRDSKMLQQEALMLRDKMQTIKLEIAKVEKDTGDSMASLEKLDRIKTELQTAKDALHEADNWMLLAADIEEVFETKNVEIIASKIASMQQSLSILANTADYENRKFQLEGLKNRLEAIASPQLVEALTSSSIEQSCKFVEIFSGMERLPQLIKYYDRCQKGALCQHWHSLVEVEQDQTVTEWMHHFYDHLLTNWNKQMKWCNQVFGYSNSLVDVYADVLLSLDPSLNECIEVAIKQQPQQLQFLVELKQTTKHFANNLQIASATQCKTKESWAKMLCAIYTPYVPFVARYNSLEENHILSQLIEYALSREDLMDQVQGLGQSIPRCISIAIDAIKRCISFTEGCGFPGLIKALKVYFTNYLDQYNSVLQQLEHKKSDHDNWNLFQMCLTLLQTAGEFLSELKRLDQEILQNVIDSSRKQTFNEFIPVLLLQSAQQELNDLITSVQEGTVSLLDSVVLAVEKFCREVHYTTYKVIFSPVQMQLDSASSTWNVTQNPSFNQDLPDYSFAPQEYITQVGEYLMTLPQHLEPFLLRENVSLISALQVQSSEVRESGAEGFADLLLGMVARGTCQMYLDHVLAIQELTNSASKQLATDIDYLGNVLGDLGFELSEPLKQVSTLLRITSENYHQQSKGSQPRLVAAVRQMRNITST